jgi:hypothetical protein
MEGEWSAKARTLVARADDRSAWVEIGTLPALLKPRGGGPPSPAPCAAILHVLRRWTLSQHFVKSIWRVDVLDQDGEDCVLRHLLRKHVVSSADTGVDETDRLAEWALWQGLQWKAVADAAAEVAQAPVATAGQHASEPQLEVKPECSLRRPSRGREEVLCEICGKTVMCSELSKHKAGKKHRRAVRLDAQAADSTPGVENDVDVSATGPRAPIPAKNSAPALEPEPEPEPEVDVPASEDPNLKEISCHRAVFGPMGLSGLSAEDARRFVLPYDYPKARAYAITFREYVRRKPLHSEVTPVRVDTETDKVAAATISMALLPFSFLLDDRPSENIGKRVEDDDQNRGQRETKGDPAALLDGMSHRLQQRSMPSQHMGTGARRVLSTLLQWAATTDMLSGRSTHGVQVSIRWFLLHCVAIRLWSAIVVRSNTA